MSSQTYAQDYTFSESQDNNVTTQYEALREFYLSTRMFSESSMPLHNWSFDSDAGIVIYCNFSGVTCDSNYMVTNLELNSTQLSGSLPDTIGDFSKLQRLRLYNNSIQGTIPDSLLKITSLKLLNLGQNQISGTFPEFASSFLLSRLSLQRNAVSGTIPVSTCRLTNLVVFEISQLTRMHGSIPDCFGSLTALAAFRMTDIGLTGNVPIELCNERVMNGLTPNIFGCDAIACPVGTYQRAIGRQSKEETPCTRCNVPSNVIGTTTCQWHERNEPSLPPSSLPSYAPTSIKTPTRLNSPSPIIHPNTTTTYPTTRFTVSFPTDKAPSSGPATRVSSQHPTFVPYVSNFPITRPTRSTVIPSSSPNIPYMINRSSRNRIAGNPGFASGIALLCIALIAFVVLVIAWKRRPLIPPHKRFTDETSSNHGSSMQEDSVGDGLFVNYPTILAFENYKPESKEFDVADDVSFNLNDIYFTRFDSTPRDGVDLLSLKSPMKPAIIQGTSTQIANQRRKIIAQDQNQDESISARKVRFDIPEPKSLKDVRIGDDIPFINDPAPVTREAWLSWIINPLFDPIASCGTPCRDISKGDLEISSAISLDSKYSNLSDLFAAHGAASVYHRKYDIPLEKPFPPEVSSVLGIRDINAMNDDSSINSADGSDVANVGVTFRPYYESHRRATSTWNSLEGSDSKQAFSLSKGTIEV
jgi:hypothetical protein